MSKNSIFAQKMTKLWTCQISQNKKTPCTEMGFNASLESEKSEVFLQTFVSVMSPKPLLSTPYPFDLNRRKKLSQLNSNGMTVD